MCSVVSFPAPPMRGSITLFEKDGHLHVGSQTEWERFTEQLVAFPRISTACEVGRSSQSNENAKKAFLRHHDSVWKQAVVSWHERGFSGFLEELARSKEESPAYSVARVMARILTVALRWTHSLHGSIFPHLLLSMESMSCEFSAASDWLHGQVRCFAWHTQVAKCAVALHSDVVRVYGASMGVVPTLKHKSQKNITSLAWRPFCSSTLAVACQDGVLLWQLEPTSLVARPSSGYATLLWRRGHQPVTSIAWHPKGSLLASASAADTALLIWNVSTEECVPLRRLGGGGVALLRWSPDGSRLLAATPASLFRVWETRSWTCERWSTFLGRCSAACWSPDGRRLLCAPVDRAAIYSLTFAAPGEEEEAEGDLRAGGSAAAIPLVDLSEMEVSDGKESIAVGGPVRDMVWDGSGERLAVSFRDNPQCAALFRTRTDPVLEVSPCGFVRGPPGSGVQFLDFFGAFEGGSLLSVCWSDGTVSHVPLYYRANPRTAAEGGASPTPGSPTLRFAPPSYGP